MSSTETGSSRAEESAVVAAARTGDESAFTGLVERHRRELQVHCYRILGSFEESEDLVQETFLRAWRYRESFAGRSTFRAWLYRIATNACLDALGRRPLSRQMAPSSTPGEIAWLQPYPDALLDPPAPGGDEPDSVVVAKETIELAFLVAIQHLPPKQRAVLILRDVLGWPAGETAALLEGSVAAVNSALQRARATLKQHLPQHRLEWAPNTDPTEEERAVLQRFMDASEQADMAALAAVLREDARWTMPPQPGVYVGRETLIANWAPYMAGPDAWGDWRLLPTRANRQPAAANYVRHRGASEYRAVSLDVLRVENGAIVEITTFSPDLFPAFGLPLTL